ncbi:hypothetical protein E2C01_086097 [Portunus trituberculatus]|uniref:Uncharacterized protein n=1 Tax=Portunus trituberculatus TaxID=210409 RepID=A0A5B7J4I8_PORTR|nr:hypothetical protein [Portunus trituberculatus]
MYVGRRALDTWTVTTPRKMLTRLSQGLTRGARPSVLASVKVCILAAGKVN